MNRPCVAALLALTLAPTCAAFRPSLVEPAASAAPQAPVRMRLAAGPSSHDPAAVAAGEKLVARYCARCHRPADGRRRSAPALDSQRVRNASPDALFSFLGNGDLRGGMPSWSRLPAAQRWQIVRYLQRPLPGAQATPHAP